MMSRNDPNSATGSAVGAEVPVAGTSAASGGTLGSAASQWIVACLAAMGCRRAGAKWQCPAHGHTGTHAAALSIW